MFSISIKIIIASLIVMSGTIPQYILDKPARNPQRTYYPGKWEPGEYSGQFKLGYWHKDSFNISWIVYHSEPELGYPYHYGIFNNLNDTVKVRVYFDNRSSSDYYLGSDSPENWFYPVLYDPYVDVFSSQPLSDTLAFNYRFEHWITMHNNVITEKPDTIRSRAIHSNAKPKGIVLSLWGNHWRGKFRVILKPSNYLPAGVNLVLDNSNNVFTIDSAQSKNDSINAYCMISSNALLRREFNLFNAYIDSVFYINPQSIPGWALKYSAFAAQGNWTLALSVIDSLLFIIDMGLDPFVPDSSLRSSVHRSWLDDFNVNYRWEKWRRTYPNETKTFFPQ